MPNVLRSLIFIFSLLCFSAAAYSQSEIKENIMHRYTDAVRMAERLQLSEDDLLQVIPRLKEVTNQIFVEDYDAAASMLTMIESDLDLLIEKEPTSVHRVKKYIWLELFFDIFQKFVFLVIFAFFFTKWKFFNLKFHRRKFDMMGCVYIALLLGTVSIVLSFIDVSRYGESAWGFFDIQIVLVTVCALIGGIGSGLLAGVWVGLFRWVLSPEAYIYIGIISLVGFASGLFSKRIDDFKKPKRVAYVVGAVMGLLHGLMVYVPVVTLMPWYYFIGTIISLMILEGLAVGLFFTVIAYVLNEQNRKTLEHDLLKSQLLFLQAQMNPHFLFNALNTIAAICMKEHARGAQKLIVKLAELLRRTLKRIDEEVTLKDEMAYIDAYLEIEKARFRDRINVVKKVDLNPDEWNVKLPILILQPIVENSIHHGIGQKVEGGTITFDLSHQSGHVCIEISDDGVGMDAQTIRRIQKGDKSVSKKGNGIGMNNINERLTRLFGKDYALEFHSEKDKGTRICVRIPKKR